MTRDHIEHSRRQLKSMAGARPDYEKYVATVVQKEKQLIERLKLKELMAKG